MNKQLRSRKGRSGAALAPPAASSLTPEATEVRALLRRIPDGQKAALKSLAGKDPAGRERILAELARALGREALPLVRAAAMGADEELAASSLRVLPVFGTRAAADVLLEAYGAHSEGERARLAWQAAQVFQARSISVSVPRPADTPIAPRLHLRETLISAPDGVGSRSIAARFQDSYGVWHAVFVLWNDQAGIKDGFKRGMSRHEWEDRMQQEGARHCPLTACPADYARWQVAEARRINEQSGLGVDDHLKAWDELLGPPPADYVVPDATAILSGASEEQRATWLQEGAQLFRNRDVAIWFLEAADCVEWARRWAALQAAIRKDKENTELRADLGKLVEAATDELLTPELRALYQGRLLDLARIGQFRGDTVCQARAAVVAQALADGKPASISPFLVAMTERSLMTAYDMIQRGDDLERARYKPRKRYS